MKLLAGNSNLPLARSIADYLGTPLTDASVRRFADEEVFVEINENVRGEDVFVLQSTSFPANDNLMELLICIDALRRASAHRITAVLPYFGYARQDRKPGPRTPISAKLVANLITTAGANMALLDAFALAVALRCANSLADGLDRFVRSRRAHVLLYQWMSRLLTPVYQSGGVAIPYARDRIVAPLSRLRFVNRLQARMVAGLIGDPLRRLGLDPSHAFTDRSSPR